MKENILLKSAPFCPYVFHKFWQSFVIFNGFVPYSRFFIIQPRKHVSNNIFVMNYLILIEIGGPLRIFYGFFLWIMLLIVSIVDSICLDSRPVEEVAGVQVVVILGDDVVGAAWDWPVKTVLLMNQLMEQHPLKV